MKKKRNKQSAILPSLQEQIEQMPEHDEFGFAYAVNYALAAFFQLPAPATPGKRISQAARNVSSEKRIAAGRKGGHARAESLTSKERTEIAQKAVRARIKKSKNE